MEYFIAIDGEKVGPLTQYRVVQMLREEEISFQHKAWHKELDNWMPIEEIPSMKSAVEALQRVEPEEYVKKADSEGGIKSEPERKEKKVVPVATEVRPLLRFWARTFDYCIVFTIVYLFAEFEFLEQPPDLTYQGFSELMADARERSERAVESGEMLAFIKLGIFSMLLWNVVEGLMLSLFGTTPGKALFGIRVLTLAGEKVSALKGIIRSFLVYILGVALFLHPLLSFAAMTFAFFRLMARGSTFWDSTLKMRVVHPPMGMFRIVLAITAFVALMLLQNLKSIL